VTQLKYTMTGKDGELSLTVNGFVLAYADTFTAALTEQLKDMALRGQRWTVPSSYNAKIILRGLTGRHPQTVNEALKAVSVGQSLDFRFEGFYLKNEKKYPVAFCRLVPVNGDLDDFMDGYIDDWEFEILALGDDVINEFKKAHG